MLLKKIRRKFRANFKIMKKLKLLSLREGVRRKIKKI